MRTLPFGERILCVLHLAVPRASDRQREERLSMKVAFAIFIVVALLGAGCASSSLTYDQVWDGLGKCDAFEMGTAEPQQHFGKPQASGHEMCAWKAQQTSKLQKCVLAGRVYGTPTFTQTGYGVWSCARPDIVSQTHNGWALCCPIQP